MSALVACAKPAVSCTKYVHPSTTLTKPAFCHWPNLLSPSSDFGPPQKYKCHPVNLIAAADGSAAMLVNLLARDFNCFRDEHVFEGRRKPIRLLKRAQILVADLWACFEGDDFGDFWDIDKITMFADYRVPQMLNSMGCLLYSPPLDLAIRGKKNIPSGSNWELQLRGKYFANGIFMVKNSG